MQIQNTFQLEIYSRNVPTARKTGSLNGINEIIPFQINWKCLLIRAGDEVEHEMLTAFINKTNENLIYEYYRWGFSDCREHIEMKCVWLLWKPRFILIQLTMRMLFAECYSNFHEESTNFCRIFSFLKIQYGTQTQTCTPFIFLLRWNTIPPSA